MNQAIERNMVIEENNKKKFIVARARVSLKDFRNVNSYSSPARFFTSPKVFVGVARLKDGDKCRYDDAVYIAKMKLERQYNKYVARCFKEEKDLLEDALGQVNNSLTKANNIIESATRQIERIANRDE